MRRRGGRAEKTKEGNTLRERRRRELILVCNVRENQRPSVGRRLARRISLITRDPRYQLERVLARHQER